MDKRFVTIWLLTCVSAASADFTYTEKCQVTLQGPGVLPGQFIVTTIYRFRGDRMSTQSLFLREGKAAEKGAAIVDLAEGTIITIFDDKKEYLRRTFQEVDEGPALGPPIKLKVSADHTKETKTLSGVQAELVKLTVDSDKQAERVSEFEAWLGAAPGYESVWSFYERFASKLPLNRRMALTAMLLMGAMHISYLTEAHIQKPPMEGLPLWSAWRTGGQGPEMRVTTEVLSWSSDPIDPSVMRVPEGFSVMARPSPGEKASAQAPSAGASPGSRPQRVRVASDVQESKLVRRVEPVYPPRALQERIQGTVQFNVIIGKNGTVQNITVVNGHPLLVAAAMEAVKQYAYQARLLNGEPVEVVTQVDVKFTLP